MPVDVLSVGEAQDLLRFCLGKGGEVKPGKHFFQQLEEEGLMFPDAWHVLRTGHIYKPPEHDVKTGEWKYRVEGHEPDGKWIAIVFCFKTIDKVFLITVFSVQERRRLP